MNRDRSHEYDEDHGPAPVERATEGTPGKHTLTEHLHGPRRLIAYSVGAGGRNDPHDVGAIQHALAQHGYSPGPIDRVVGPRTLGAIRAFQATLLARPDGLVEVGGKTERALGRAIELPRPEPRPAAAPGAANHAALTADPAAHTPRAGAKAAPDDKNLRAVERYRTFIDEAATKYGMNPDHIKAIMAVESKGDPDATSGAAFGLMQITRGTWETTRKQDPDLRGYAFEANWRDPRINTLFGAAVLKAKAASMGVSPTDDSFAALAVTAYNAGEGTVKTAMALARAAGSADPSADFLRPAYLKPAIAKYGLHTYYLTGKGKKSNTSGTEDEALELKYREITRYAPQVERYLGTLGAERTAEPTAEGRPAAATAHQVEEPEPQHAATPEREHPAYTQISTDFHAAIAGTSLTWHDALWLPQWSRYARPTDLTNTDFDTALRNIERQAAALHGLAGQLGKPLRVHCWLRPPAYNQKVHGARNSAHLRGTATDFHVEGMTAEEVRRIVRSTAGLYPGAGELGVSWVHLDLEHHRWFHP